MELLVIKTKLPTLEANFEVVKQQLIDGLKTYDVIITAETVKDGKSMAAEINKIKSAIKDQQKKALEDIMGPVDGFKDKIKELMDLAEEAKEKITAQVKAYEEKTKSEIHDKILSFTLEEIEKAELRDPFFKTEVLDLVKLTAVTKTGNLTSATTNAIKGRVSEQKNLQLEEDARIAQEIKDKEDEIAKIKEEARIEAEANIQVHVTVDPIQQQVPKEVVQQRIEDIRNHTYEHEPTHEEYNPDTGEVYDVPAYMDNPREEIVHSDAGINTVPQTTVKVLIDIEIDISKIPNITDHQIVTALDKKLKDAGINNAQIRDLHRL